MNAIEFKNVSKKFKKGEQFDSLRELIPNLVKGLFSLNGRNGELKEREFWALKDVSFAVKKGEVLGIIGPNGAGKSTILKLLSRILKPTKGEININGKLSALIEVGAGFHEDLTGRENIYINGAIMGMKKKEIDKKLNEIVEFSEISEFIDTPVKRYSSGMYARLGFSVAAHMDPDILLVDEVLSVGDMCFQTKCLEKIKMMKVSGVTIIFISHNMEAIASICEQTLLLNKGVLVAYGDTDKIINDYQKNGVAHSDSMYRLSGQKQNDIVDIENIIFLDEKEQEKRSFRAGEEITIRIIFNAHKFLSNPDIGLAFYDNKGTLLYAHHSKVDNCITGDVNGRFQVDVKYNTSCFQPGVYYYYAGIYDTQGLVPYEYSDRQHSFAIHGQKGELGLMHVPHSWKILHEVTI